MPRITSSQLHQKMAVEGTYILIVSGSGGTEKGGLAIASGGITIHGPARERSIIDAAGLLLGDRETYTGHKQTLLSP